MTELRPIRDAKQHATALKEIQRLWDAKHGSPEGDRLEVLAMLVEAYEKTAFPIDKPDPIEAIKFRMEQMGYNRKDLEPALGGRNRVADVLNRRRQLSLTMIQRLNAMFKIPAEVLIQPVKIPPAVMKKSKKSSGSRAHARAA